MFARQCSPYLCDSAGLAFEHAEIVLLEVQDRDQLTEGVLLLNLFRVGHDKVQNMGKRISTKNQRWEYVRVEGGLDQSLYLPDMYFSFPTAARTVKKTNLSPLSSHIFFSSLWTSSSSRDSFRSSFKVPSSMIELTKSSQSRSATSYQNFFTMGIWTVAEVGAVSSCFLLVKMSVPTMVALAEPCFPGLAVEYSITLQGKPLSMQQPPFLTAPAGTGSQWDDPASVCQKSSMSDIVEQNIMLA